MMASPSATATFGSARRYPIRLEGRVLGCANLSWRMKLMTLAGHLDELRGAVSAAERQATEVGARLWDRVGVDEA